MNLILNTNELGFIPFLNSCIDSFIVGFKNFCVNQKYSLTLNQIKKELKCIKENKKKLYLSINLFAKERDIKKLNKLMPKLINLDVDGYIVSDLGVLNLFKKYNLENKIVLDLHTYVTNKYSANSLLNLGVNAVTLSKEITLNDIKEIASFNNYKVTLLVQGYVPITYSNRSILSCYYNKYKLNKPHNNTHYIKEESRDNYYYLEEKNGNLIVYNDEQYCLFPYLKELIEEKITNFQIDANFLSKDQIDDYITNYSNAISFIKNGYIDDYNKLKSEFEKMHTFNNPFLHNESFLLKEEK